MNNVVYHIICYDTLKSYVGGTCAGDRRRKQHFYSLREDDHHSQKLQYAYNKYGKDRFLFRILEDNIDENKILEREQYWMDLLDSYENGYNCTPYAGGACYRAKKPNLHRQKAVVSYNLDTKEINIYDSIKEAKQTINGDISACFRKKYRCLRAGNKLWFLKTEFTEELLQETIAKYYEPSIKKEKKINKKEDDKLNKRIIRSDGRIYRSVGDAARELGISTNTIYRIIRGERKTACGFSFAKYSGNDAAVEALHDNILNFSHRGRRILCSDGRVFQSCAQMSREFNIKYSVVSSRINSRLEINGLCFEFIDAPIFKCNFKARQIIRNDGKQYESIASAARDSNGSSTGVCAVLDDRQKFHKGFSFGYLDEPEKTKERFDSLDISRKIPSIPIIRSDGRIYESIYAASLDMGIDKSWISRIVSGRPKYKTAKGFSFKYLNDIDSVSTPIFN